MSQSSAKRVRVDRQLLSDLLHELFPYGLTDDCPARKHAQHH